MNKYLYSLLLLFFAIGSIACSDDEKVNFNPVTDTISPISRLQANATDKLNEIQLSWINPSSETLCKVEIAYEMENYTSRYSPNPIIIDTKPGQLESYLLSVPRYGKYKISVVAISRFGKRSAAVKTEGTPLQKDEGENNEGNQTDIESIFIGKADTLFNAMNKLFWVTPWGWAGSYPRGDGYWEGTALIWGYGAAFSGYTALREATQASVDYKNKLLVYDNLYFNKIEKFINSPDGKAKAYAVWPGSGDQRLYDDNAWVGLDMIDLYKQTNIRGYLDRAILVWDYLQVGTDDYTGGGIYWDERHDAKHTCSTAPGAVLSAKIYLATQEQKYLDQCIAYYNWLLKRLQDPLDYLFWDNCKEDEKGNIVVSKPKYAYNSGQPLQVAVLLYKITNEEKYLVDARRIAEAIYNKWSYRMFSQVLGEEIQILENGHVWFYNIAFRGFVELYSVDKSAKKYIELYANTLRHVWLIGKDKETNILSTDIREGKSEKSYDILHQGAYVEMLSRLSLIDIQEK